MPQAERRRWLNLGPGLIAATGLVVILAVSGRLPRLGGRPELPQHSQLPAAEPLAPELTWLLRHAEPIGLTPEQIARVETAVAEWEQQTAADRAELQQQAAAVGGRLDQDDRPQPQAILDQAERYQALSARLAEARQTAWQAALGLLTEPQRQTVRELRAAVPLEMR